MRYESGIGVSRVGGENRVMSPEQCRRNGAACLQFAKSATIDAHRLVLLQLADRWRSLADRIERASAAKDKVTGNWGDACRSGEGLPGKAEMDTAATIKTRGSR
jgi:hypothetical protein